MNATAIYSGLLFTTSEVNANFRIKVNYVDENGKKVNTLVGLYGLIKLVGMEFVNKFLQKAFAGREDKLVCKLRRGIKVTFYVK